MIERLPLIASIDVGTNSFHLAICSVNSRGMMNIILREKEVVRLGSGSGDMKFITNDALQRGVETMVRFNELAKSKNAEIRAVATSAVREALNKEEFLSKVKEATGIDIEVVSGAEEGRLIYIGASHALPIINKRSLVIDIGGGSTETIVGYNGDILYVHSAKLGAIRLTQRFKLNKNISKSAINDCRNYIQGDWMPVLKRVTDQNIECFVGTSGTIINIALMAINDGQDEVPDMYNAISVNRNQLFKVIKKIVGAKNVEQIKSLPGIDVSRADIIVGGALILENALLNLNIDKIILSSYALREGVVFDTLQKLQAIKKLHHLSSLRYHSIYSIANEYRVNLPHAEHVKATALSLFDDLKPLHNLGYDARELLEAAAILHDVGYHISIEQHHKHSYYLISNCIMPGFTNDEAEVIANIARYHRKSHPKKKHENFSKLTPEKQEIVKLLASFLRIGEGIDRRQLQIVEKINVKFNDKEIIVTVIPKANNLSPDIEIWGANRRKLLLEETLGKSVIFELENKRFN